MNKRHYLALLTCLTLAWLSAVPTQAVADESPGKQPTVAAVAGQSDWSLLTLDPSYITTDGISITIRDMPLAGRFNLMGDDVAIEGTIHGILDADLDMNGTGPIYGTLVVTQSIRGKEKKTFDGRFFGRTNGWLASGQILLQGRGHSAGTTIIVSFLETGPDTETFLLNGHLFDRDRE
jgi:hypothetical protein